MENRSRQSVSSLLQWGSQPTPDCGLGGQREREPLHWNDEFQRIGSSNIENTRSFLLSESDYKSSERALALLHNIVLGIVGKLKLNWNVLLKLTGRCQIMTFWLETNWFCPVEKESWQHLFSIVWNLKSVWDRENISSMGALALTLYPDSPSAGAEIEIIYQLKQF